METKHTPLPWASIETDGFYDIHHFTEGQSFHEVVGSEGIPKKEDADYIVLACNLHPQLLEALELSLRAMCSVTLKKNDALFIQETAKGLKRVIALATGSEVAK